MHTEKRTVSSPKSSLSISREWLRVSFSKRYDLSIPLRGTSLSDLIFALLYGVFDQNVLGLPIHEEASTVLLDTKGRDPLHVLDPNSPSPAMHDELLYLRGVVVDTASDGEKNTPAQEPFEVRLETRFSEFTGRDQIAHQVFVRTTGPSASWLSTLCVGNISRAVPLRIDYLRIGIDLFTRGGMFGWVSRTPTVTQTILLELRPDELQIRMVAEKLKNRTDLPIQRKSVGDGLQQALLKELQFDIISDIISKT